MIVDEIIKQLPNSKIKYVEKNEDPRDYRVSFKKINDELGFVTTFTVPDGIKQTIKAINDRFILDPDDPKYKKMSNNFENSIAFSAACDLVFKGRTQPSGYTEPLLHQKRLEKKVSN